MPETILRIAQYNFQSNVQKTKKKHNTQFCLAKKTGEGF